MIKIYVAEKDKSKKEIRLIKFMNNGARCIYDEDVEINALEQHDSEVRAKTKKEVFDKIEKRFGSEIFYGVPICEWQDFVNKTLGKENK